LIEGTKIITNQTFLAFLKIYTDYNLVCIEFWNHA